MSINKKIIPFIFKYHIFIITFFLFLTPFLFWQSGYMVGGDDSKLYYLYPWEYLRNYTTTIIGDNMLGNIGAFFPQSYILGFASFLVVLKKLFFFLNTQKLAFGIILAGGFLSFYFLQRVFFQKKNIAFEFSALLYILSPIPMYTVWTSQLFAIFLIPIFPLLLILLILGIRKNDYRYAILNSLIITVFSTLILSVPWFFGLLIASVPIMFSLIRENHKVFFLHCTATFFCVFFLNIHWIGIFLMSMTHTGGSNVVGAIGSQEFREQNHNVIRAVSENNELHFPLLNLFHYNIQKDFGWNQLTIFEQYHLPYVFLGAIFIIVILTGFILSRREKIIYFLGATYVVCLFLFTVNIGSHGIDLFLWLNDNIPGFVMFRNMYDKAALALVFSFAILFGFSLSKIHFNKIGMFLLYGVTGISILVHGFPLLSGKILATPIWTTNASPVIEDFNQEFIDLTKYFSTHNSSERVLWWPMTTANYIEIKGSNNRGVYSGVSPMQFIANQSDYTGLMSFDYIGNTDNHQKVISMIQSDTGSVDFLNFAKKYNIQNIIINHDVPDSMKNSYLYTLSKKGDFFDMQNTWNIIQKLHLEKIGDFGTRYSLYHIPGIAPMIHGMGYQSSFAKQNSATYNLNETLKVQSNIYFSESFHPEWKLYLEPYAPLDCGSGATVYSGTLSRESGTTMVHPSSSPILGEEETVGASRRTGTGESYHVTECPSENRFYAGGELAKLWEKPIFDNTHKMVYDYANQWTIDPEYIRAHYSKEYYHENPDGTIDVRMTMYFRPQSYFYAGLIISGVTLFGCVSYLVISSVRARRRVGK